MAKIKMTYDQAYKELMEIMDALNSDELNIDELTEKVKRAAALIAHCKSKLKDTEADISEIFEE